MTYRVKRLFLDSQEVKCFGIFQTEGEAKMRLAQVLEEALQPICENYAQRPGKVTINVWKPWWKRLIFWQ